MLDPHPPGCPHPTAETPAQIEFVREKRMVDWLRPSELVRAAVKAAVAATFGSYADKRELQAAMAPLAGVDDTFAPDEQGNVWFDYVADLGDGFDATYAVARLVAADLGDMKRGQFTILGGDQVYPTAARDDYQNRFIGPYRAALPYAVDAPALYALPGNHDWYDGLTSFLRIFCQRKEDRTGRWIGGWRTRQHRSYFAIALPQNWWIWAIDSQLDADMDHPQLVYFEGLAKRMLEQEPDASKHKIILVTAQPTWVNCPGEKAMKTCRNYPELFNTLAHFEKAYIRAYGFQLRLALSGDLHHYVRYETPDHAENPHTIRVTSGGGGAFLFGTAETPDVLTVREERQDAPTAYVKKASYPDTKESQRYAHGIWALPFRNYFFGGVLATVYLLFAWLLQTGSRGTGGLLDGGSLLDSIRINGPQLGAFLIAFMFSPLATTVGLVVVGGFWGYTLSQAKGHPKLAKISGLLHGLAHVVLVCVLFAAIASALGRTNLRPGGVPFSLAFMVLLFVSGYLLGCWLFAAYLWISTRTTGVHAGDLFSSMALTDCRNFLRMRLDAQGRLTVYTIGLKNVPTDWTFEPPGDECGRPWFQSKTFMTGDYAPRVIETFVV